MSQCAMPVHLGGAHFVTIQAAVELQVICDLERQYRELDIDYIQSLDFLNAIRSHEPSAKELDAQLDTYSTTNGANYGMTSPKIRAEVYQNAVRARRRLNLFHEVEWVQFPRGYALTRDAIELKNIGDQVVPPPRRSSSPTAPRSCSSTRSSDAACLRSTTAPGPRARRSGPR